MLFSKDLGGVFSQVTQENSVVHTLERGTANSEEVAAAKAQGAGPGSGRVTRGSQETLEAFPGAQSDRSHADRGAGGAGTSETRAGLHLQSWCVEAGRLGRDQRDSRLGEVVEPTGSYTGGAVVTMGLWSPWCGR